MPAAEVGRGVVRATVAVDRDQLALGPGLRCAVGIAAPLVVGLAVGQPLEGVAAAAGAISVGFASFQGVYRTRAAVMVLASLGMGVSTLTGGLIGHSDIAAALVTGAWGFAAGLLVAVGQAASVVGLQSVVALIIVGQLPMSAGQVLARSGLVVAGGLVQTLLVVAVWPLRRYPAERRALAATYRSLADFAVDLPRSGARPPATGPLGEAKTALGDPQPFGRRSEVGAFQGLLDEAERIRTRLAALARDHVRLRDTDLSTTRTAVEDLATGAADVLAEVAIAIGQARAPRDRARARRRIRDAAAVIEQTQREPASPASWGQGRLVSEIVADVRALRGQLRSVARIAAVPAGAPPPADQAALPRRRAVLPVRDAVSTLRANLTFESAACRHAIRLAVTLAAATAGYRLLPVARGYWLPLTVLVVLKPDFAATLSRGAGRVVGTLIGAGLATLVAATLRPGQLALAVLVVVLAWGAAAVFRANYALFAVCITALIVFLLAFAGLPEVTAVADRTIDTVVGGALALLAYAVWPTWESAQVPERLAALLAAQRRYGTGVLGAYTEPAAADRPAVREARAAARLARTNAEASVDRMLGEPARTRRLPADTALGILASIRRYALAALALDAHADERREQPVPALVPLQDQIATALNTLSQALRSGRTPGPLPPLRDTQLALKDVLRQQQSGPDAALLLSETDLMVDSVNSIADRLGVDWGADRQPVTR